MQIIEETYQWRGPLYKRATTDLCVIHHEAGKGMTAQQIHKMHRDVNGWNGIAYNFYVRMDGSVYRGRPIDAAGGHTLNFNHNSIGVCFEGNFDTVDRLQGSQYQAGVELLRHIKTLYPQIKIVQHKDLNATACPGKYFPFEKLKGDAEKVNTVPETSKAEFEEAVKLGITDGSNPGGPATRWQVALMVLRGVKYVLERKNSK